MNQDQAIFAGSILVLSILAALWLLRRAKLWRARNWPTVVGRLESAAVSLTSGGGQPGWAAYYADLTYSYQVQDHAHRGTLRRRFILKGAADKWIAKFTNSDCLTVRYNPAKARDSVVLESDHPRSAPRSVLLCLVIFASLLCPAYRSAFAQTPTNYTADTPSVERLNTEINVCFGRAGKSVHLLQTESSETQRRTTCSSVQNRFPPRKGSQ